MKMISLKNVTMDFELDLNRTNSIKEWFVNKLTGKGQRVRFRAVDNVNFDVLKGQVVGLIGSNGSGKSTLLKIISGVYKPTGGSVQINGNIAPLLELGSGFDPELTGRENIVLNGSILGYSKEYIAQREQEIIDFAEMGDFIDVPVKTYSSGMTTRLAFAVATAVNPEILIVDEILAVGDEAFQRKSFARMMELMGNGATVLFVSHTLAQIRKLCDTVVWLDKGKVRMIGAPDDVCVAYEYYMSDDYKKLHSEA